MEHLCAHLKHCIGYRSVGVEAIERAADTLRNARYQLDTVRAGELVAEELRQAQSALSEISDEGWCDRSWYTNDCSGQFVTAS